MEFSIVVPFYNAANYIERCLTSIKSQTLSDYEVILVNDGSCDDSLLKVKNFIKDDKRFKIINQENQGSGKAKNKGLMNARGEYILFVDSDDYLELDTLETLDKYIKAYRGNIDVVCFNLIIEKRRIKHKVNLNGNLKGIKAPDKAPEILNISSTACSKLVRKKYMIDNHILFDEDLPFDDILYTLRLMAFAEKVLFIDEYLYHYVQRGTSLTHMNSSLSIIQSCNVIINYEKNDRMLQKYKEEIDFTLVNIILFVFLAKENAKDRNSKVQYKLVNYIKDNFKNIEQNNYFTSKKKQIQLLMDYKFNKYFFRYNLKNYVKYKFGVL